MIRVVRGFKDILPEETGLWQHVEGLAREVFHQFGFSELRIPVLEQTELFARSIGTDTDIVEKEMYTFTDRGGSSLTLRPEATASVVRAYIEHKLYAKDPVWKLYTLGPMFRRERPQRGRYRQFHQINGEVFGLHDPKVDTELIYLLSRFMERLEVPGIVLHINSLGCPACRPAFKEALNSFLAEHLQGLCSDCLRRRVRNPLRVFDCKVKTCRETVAEAPSVLDHLCGGCRNHFDAVQRGLEELGIPYERDHRLVRGLDYYTRTAFEVIARSLGAQDAVAGGGRYDGLVKALGGPDQPGVGFAIGVDRLIDLLAARAEDFQSRPRLFIAALGARAQDRAFQWLQALRLHKVSAEMDFEDRSLKAQMRRANKLEASYALIVGDRELQEGSGVLRDLRTKRQEKVPLNGLVDLVAEKVASPSDST
jgi:histidyl-tRNA synthetase